MVIHSTIVVFHEKQRENQSGKFMSLVLVLLTDTFQSFGNQ